VRGKDSGSGEFVPVTPTEFARAAHETARAEDLVTDEMVGDAFCAWHEARGTDAERIYAALRAVAPLIAARADPYKRQEREHIERAVAAEREVIAKIVKETEDWNDCLEACNYILAAIRARGETTTKTRSPGEIDWSATDKD
jgi:hypothetical protein